MEEKRRERERMLARHGKVFVLCVVLTCRHHAARLAGFVVCVLLSLPETRASAQAIGSGAPQEARHTCIEGDPLSAEAGGLWHTLQVRCF